MNTSNTFERKTLYEEVWAEPMSKVARPYDISDVGLRKICVKLGIPISPRGHWAKVASGRVVKKIPLPRPEVQATWERSINILPREAELKQRLVEIRAKDVPSPDLSEIEYLQPSELAQLGREATQIAITIEKIKRPEGIIEFSDRAWAELSVSNSMKSRSLFLLDRLAFAVHAVGGQFQLKKIPPERDRFVNGREQPPYERGFFQIHDSKYFVRVKERLLNEEIIEPAKSRPRAARYEPDWEALTRRKKYVYTSTGKLRLIVLHVGYKYEEAKVEDTETKNLEEKILGFAQRLEAKSLKKKLDNELWRQKELERQRKIEAWQENRAEKEKLLEKLKSFESLASNLDRAELLRRLANRIRESADCAPDLQEDLKLLIKMADWLDPLLTTPWPKIDDVPDKNPYSAW